MIKLDALNEVLGTQLTEPGPAIEALITALSKGQPRVELWAELHSAARRDEELAELAFAYEHALNDKRVKAMTPAAQAELFMHAARFFGDFFSDPDGAVGYAERALAAVPGHSDAFGFLEGLLETRKDHARLARLYVDAAALERDRDRHLELLRGAARRLEQVAEADDLAIDVYQRISRIDPTDASALSALEIRFNAAGRHRDAARLLEQALSRFTEENEESHRVRSKLLELYTGELGEPQRAISHVEALLIAEPGEARALAVAEALLEQRVVAPRAAAALSDAYEKLGRLELAAAMLTRELKLATGVRRAVVQKRLAVLKQDALGDPAGALELLGPAVAADPGDDDLRRRYVELSVALGQPLEAAKRLSRALQTVRESSVKARVGVEIGQIYLASGELKRAVESLETVVSAGGDDQSALVAAQKLTELHAEAGDQLKLAVALELVVRLEPDLEVRRKAARRLARLCEETGETQRAITAYRALIDSPWAEEALTRLQALHESSASYDELVDVLERRSWLCATPEQARELAFRAAEIRSTKLRDRGRALQAWQNLVARFGASRDCHARLLPLYEQEKRWSEMARILETDLGLSLPEELPPLLGKLGQIRLLRLGDTQGALSAFRSALVMDSKERVSRSAVEKLLISGAVRLEAAEALERIYRGEKATKQLVRVLEVRAELAPTPEERLAALKEAVELTESVLGDADSALTLAGQGLKEAVGHRVNWVPEWLEIAKRLATASGDPANRVRVMTEALGLRAVDSDELLELARAAAEALAVSGDIAGAVSTYRRALEYAPTSAELVRRIDELLTQQGSPMERVALYQAALDQPCDSVRRRELRHALARVQRLELSDLESAMASWRFALEEDSRDATAHQSLLDAYLERSDYPAAYAELNRALGLAAQDRRPAILKRMAELQAEHGDPAVALAHFRELLSVADLTAEELERIEELGRRHKEPRLVCQVLERRVTSAEGEERAELLERLGRVQALELNDADAAAHSWLEGARLSEGDEARALRLYERALHVAPAHQEAAERLMELYAKSGAWDKVPAVFDVLLQVANDLREPVRRLLGLEEQAVEAGAGAAFVSLIDAALRLEGTGTEGLDRARSVQLALTKARVLAHHEDNYDQVAEIYRKVLSTPGAESSAAAEAFESFLTGAHLEQPRIEDRRWLYKWRAEHQSDPTATLLAWACAEEDVFGDLSRAAELYRLILQRDSHRTDALAELARLEAAQGNAEGAILSLTALRQQSQGEAVIAVDRQIARLLVQQLGRVGEALTVAEALLEAVPGDQEALLIVHQALGLPEHQARAAELLERTSAAADEPRARAAVLEALLAIPVVGTQLTSARQGWFERLLECRAEDPEAALEIALRGAEEHPSSDALWSAAERLARKLDRPNPVAQSYAVALEKELTPVLAEELGRRLVEFHEEWFEEPDRVISLLKRVLTLSPGAGWAFDRLKLAFNATARWAELFELYDLALAKAATPAERAELLREAAMAAKDFAGDPVRAVGYLAQLNGLFPEDVTIEASLERLYEREAQRRPLIDLLTRRLERHTGVEGQGLRLRIAGLWLDIDEPIPAFQLLREIRDEAPGSEEPFRLFERLVTLPASRDSIAPGGQASGGRKPTVRDLAAVFLREHYEGQDRLADAARMMEVGLESAPSRQDRIARLEEIVRVRLDRLDDASGAFSNVCALVTLVPQNAAYRDSLRKLSQRIGAAERRAALLVNVSHEQDGLDISAELQREAAGVYVSELGDAATAIALHLEILAAAANYPVIALTAARDLDPLLGAAGRLAEQCDVLERLAVLEPEPAARRVVLGRAALLARGTLGAPERAIQNWRLRLADDPTDAEALDGLIEVLAETGRAAELVTALGARVELEQDPAAVRQDRVRIARLYAESLGDRSSAILSWYTIRERSGRDRESFESLVPLLESELCWRELAELLHEEAAEESDPERRAQLQRRLGQVHRTKTGDVIHALRAFVEAGDWEEAIATADADGIPKEEALRACQELLDRATEVWSGDPTGAPGAARAAAWAIEELGERLRALGHHDEVVKLLLRGSQLPFEKRRQRELRRDAACVCSDHLQEPERAIEIYRGLFAEDPGDPVATASVTRLALLLEERGAHGEIAELWEQQARTRADSGDRSAAAALFARAAELWEVRVEDVERAIADYHEGARLGGEVALEALARIYDSRGEYARVAEALELLRAQSSREALADRALRLAAAYVAIGERQLARGCLEQASGVALDAGAVRRRLAELYREDQDFGRLAELLTMEASRAPEARSRLALLREAARLHVEKRSQPLDAVPLFEQAVELDPEDPTLRLELSSALEKGGRLEEASVLLRRQIERYGARRPKDRALVHFQLARVSLAAGRRAEAMSELGVANKIDPAHPGILQALAHLAFEEGQHDRAERMYRALLLVLKPSEEADAPSRAEALLDLSEIALAKDEPVRAAEFVESAFETALDSPREADCLERALARRQRQELLARAVESRLGRATTAKEAARALADLVMLHAGNQTGSEPDRGSLRIRALSIQSSLEEKGEEDDVAWSALASVYDWLGDADAEIRVLERRVAMFAQNDQLPVDASVFYRLAEVRLGDLVTHAEGIELLERGLSLQPDAERAELLLRRSLERDPSDERTVALLERVARTAGHERTVCEALVLRLRLPHPEPVKVREAVELAQRLGDRELSEAALRQAMLLELPDIDAAWIRSQLADLLVTLGQLREALQLREESAEYLPGEEARKLLLDVAQAAAKTLNDADFAARVYQALLTSEPADRLAWEPLLELYRKQGAKEQLAALLDQTAPLVDSLADRGRLRLEQANIQLESGDVERALQTLQEIMEDDPGQRAAALLLAELLEGAGRQDELLRLLGSQLDAAKDRQELPTIVTISVKIGALLEAQDRGQQALDTYLGILEWDPTNPEALAAVVRLADQKGDPTVLADALEGLLRLTSGEPAVGIAARLVQLRVELRDAPAAERALELGFLACPANGDLRDGLLTRYRKRQEWTRVASVLEKALQALPKDPELVRQLIEAYRAAGEPDRALQVLEGVMAREPENAALLRERALLLQALGRADEGLADLERAHAQSGAYAKELVEALEQAASMVEGAAQRVLVLRLVDIMDQLGETEGERARLTELIKADAKDRDALRRLAALETRSESWAAASTAYRRLIALEEGDALVDVALRLAEACQRAERFVDARGGLERALKVAPQHAELRARLRELYEVSGANRELAMLLEEDAGAESQVGLAIRLLLRSGALWLAPDGDPNEAIRVLDRARKLSPESLDGVVLLARALSSAGRRDDALGVLSETVLAHKGKRVKALSEIYRELSRLQLEDGILTDALDALSKAFELDLRNGALAMSVGELAVQAEEWEIAARAFRSVTLMKAPQPDSSEGATSEAKAESHYQLALMAQRQGDVRKARLLLSKALTERSDHERARTLIEELSAR